jgi:hypothetical protein
VSTAVELALLVALVFGMAAAVIALAWLTARLIG